jgi:4-amino-4-deoxy-L-arabinose transferase-like glycosyltransferase
MAENLAAAHLGLAAFCLLALARREPGARLATAIVVGLLPLSRAEGALLLPLALLVDALASRGLPKPLRLRAGALLAFGLAAPSALWVTRNARHLGHPVLADRSGLALSVRAALDADVERFGFRSALLAWTPLEVERREDRRSSPEPTWLEYRPLGGDNYYFRTLRRWQEERRRDRDSLAVDALFRRTALERFVTHPWDHLRGAAAVAWRGAFAERSPGWAVPFDLTFALGLALATALAFVTATAVAQRALPVVAFLAPAWILFAFHVAATELLPRYAVPLLPLAWAALALSLIRRAAASAPAVPAASDSTA